MAIDYPKRFASSVSLFPFPRIRDMTSELEVEECVIAAVMEITKRYPDDSVLIVSHDVSLAIIICHAQGISISEVYEHIPENAKLYRVAWK